MRELYIREWREDGTVDDRLATRADQLSMWWHTQVFRVVHPRRSAELSRNLAALQREQEQQEPEPDDYDPGPEVDDQGGMSEVDPRWDEVERAETEYFGGREAEL
jgi:hypothetical protein